MKSENKEYVAEYSRYLSMKYGGKRFVIVEAKTKKVVDNAQGYGYKSAKNAYASWYHKLKLNQPEPNQKADDDSMKQIVRAWMADHESLEAELQDLYQYAARTHNRVTVEDIRDIFAQAEVDVDELPFQLKDLMKYW